MSLLHPVVAKQAGGTSRSYSMAGRLYASKSGWILLSVPNSLVRGAFDALDEQGLALPTKGDGTLNAHISVMRPEEIEQIGGIDKIVERGHSFHYTLGEVRTVVPSGWKEMAKVWMIEAQSPELKKLRASYGLSPLPNENKFKFHITIAVRKKGVLAYQRFGKAAEKAKSYLANALKSQIAKPNWDTAQSIPQNLGNMLQGVAGQARQQIRLDRGSRQLITSGDSSARWNDLLNSLNGVDPVVTNPYDKLLEGI